MDEPMRQTAPRPHALEALVAGLAYRPGWTARLEDLDRGQGSEGLTLIITTTGYNSYHRPALRPYDFGPGPDTRCRDCGEPFPCASYAYSDRDDAPRPPYRVNHYLPVPPAAYDERSWRRWLLDQVLLVERHEACEFFEVDGERSYAPSHGPGNDPYIIREVGTDEDRRTSFRGELNPDG